MAARGFRMPMWLRKGVSCVQHGRGCMYCLESPQKGVLQCSMDHGGVAVRDQKLFKGKRSSPVWDFGPFSEKFNILGVFMWGMAAYTH